MTQIGKDLAAILRAQGRQVIFEILPVDFKRDGIEGMTLHKIGLLSPFCENLRGLVGGFDTYYLVAVATKKLGIGSVREIRDKKLPVRVYTQPVGALGEFAGRQLLRAVGLGYNEIKAFGGSTQHVGYNVIIDAFKDGRADILFAVVTPKHPSVSEIVSSVDVEFLLPGGTVVPNSLSAKRRKP